MFERMPFSILKFEEMKKENECLEERMTFGI